MSCDQGKPSSGVAILQRNLTYSSSNCYCCCCYFVYKLVNKKTSSYHIIDNRTLFGVDDWPQSLPLKIDIYTRFFIFSIFEHLKNRPFYPRFEDHPLAFPPNTINFSKKKINIKYCWKNKINMSENFSGLYSPASRTILWPFTVNLYLVNR